MRAKERRCVLTVSNTETETVILTIHCLIREFILYCVFWTIGLSLFPCSGAIIERSTRTTYQGFRQRYRRVHGLTDGREHGRRNNLKSNCRCFGAYCMCMYVTLICVINLFAVSSLHRTRTLQRRVKHPNRANPSHLQHQNLLELPPTLSHTQTHNHKLWK